MAIVVEGPKNFKVDFHVPLDTRFWGAIAEDVATEIIKRTEKQGLDVDDRPFAKYNPKYAAFKQQKYGHKKVNLHRTGNMLNSLARGTRGGRGWAKVFVSGSEGYKAWELENARNSREFMGLSNKRLVKIFDKISKWIEKKNQL